MLVYVLILNLHKKLRKVIVPTRKSELGNRGSRAEELHPSTYFYCFNYLSCMYIFWKIKTLWTTVVDTDKYLISLTRALFYWSWYFPQAMPAWQFNWHMQPEQQISHSVHWESANSQEHATIQVHCTTPNTEGIPGESTQIGQKLSRLSACRTAQDYSIFFIQA